MVPVRVVLDDVLHPGDVAERGTRRAAERLWSDRRSVVRVSEVSPSSVFSWRTSISARITRTIRKYSGIASSNPRRNCRDSYNPFYTIRPQKDARTLLIVIVRPLGGCPPLAYSPLKPSRTTVFKPEDVKAVRTRLGASQSEFALMIGVSVATLQNWEQGRRTPDGPALALLRVAAKNPKAVAEALHGKKRGAA